MWENNPNPLLVALRNDYLHQYAALSTNTQFVERGVKESGYVQLEEDVKVITRFLQWKGLTRGFS